jgi:ribosomal protein S17
MSARLTGLVTKAGFMDKTVTVTVSRLVQDKRTRKVRPRTSALPARALTSRRSSRARRSS